ncbi:hypothetical protein H0H93_016423 [Arthromyces matolae]|nr:hypothetical protein H0H93_016423 [Arthromyces matolae]
MDPNSQSKDIPGTLEQVEIDEEFWQDDRVLVFRCENKLYKIAVGRLQQHSEAFSQILSIPQDGAENPEGTKENPIVVPGVKTEEWRAFLKWLNHIELDPSLILTEEQLLSILKICRIWDITSGITFACHSIEQLDLRPTRMMYLGIHFSKASWIRQAVIGLMDIPLNQISYEEICAMGLKAMVTVAKAREMFEGEMKQLTYSPPPVPYSTSQEYCPSHDTCISTWQDIWIRKISRELIHPTNPLRLEHLISCIRTTQHPGMTLTCKEAAVDSLAGRPIFQCKVQIMAQAVQAICSYHGVVQE